MPFKTYLAQIGAALKQGDATEHTHRPALKTLIESMEPGLLATNEPKRITCGAPDYIVSRKGIPLGYVEAKDVGKRLDDIEGDEQLTRYRASLRNLILTDYLEFRLYRNGELVQSASLGKVQKNGVFKPNPEGIEQTRALLTWFVQSNLPSIANPRELAGRMAQMAVMIRELIGKAFAQESERGELHSQLDGFRKVLLGDDLSPAQFADMYAQTISYGLFAARCNHTGTGFNRREAAYDLPKTNPFLRKLFQHIAGADLDDRIAWAVDDLADLLDKADMSAVLADFGKDTRQEDPVVHFYETFLRAYDPKMREARGVYYTPEPVVDYIVRSVDTILKNDFDLPAGLADNSRVTLKRPKPGGKGKETIDTHRVQILDPATGTGTFLHRVVSHIRESFNGNKGMWPGYVAEHLLPRIYGFELLMAPYAVAHMKLGLQLQQSGYDFASDERLRVYLTNTLEKAHELTGLPLFTQWLAEEAAQASDIKQSAPIMVVLGNPPYSGHSANTGEWIASLLRGMDTLTRQKTGNYFECDGKPLGERNPKWLNDDYVKFIRFAQWRIEQTGYGILAFITNNGYLDNPTFRGMRQSLLNAFDDIYLIDLHGSSKKKEKTPDGGKDENVFDIQQGVSIGLFVKKEGKRSGIATVRHADLYGTREGKYQWLWSHDVAHTKWKKLEPQSPQYILIPQDKDLLGEYEQGWKITDAMPVNSVGIVTARDSLTIHWTKEKAWQTVRDFISLLPEQAREKYDLGADAQDWKIEWAQKDLRNIGPEKTRLTPILYRPFDVRHTYYTGKPSGFHCRPRGEVMGHMLAGENIGFIVPKQTKDQWDVLAVDSIIGHKAGSVYDISSLAPVYLYPRPKTDLFDSDNLSTAPGGRRPNLALEFISAFAAKLSFEFVSDGTGDLKKTFGPEDIFHYAYAVFYCPTYRSRYAQFLKSDFPRLPLTSSKTLFAKLCVLGKQLVALHLMQSYGPKLCSYPVAGNNRVDKVSFAADPMKTGQAEAKGRVYINAEQYFDDVPASVWEYQIGGYQVANKWLKDRKDRLLTFDELQHYQYIISALAETMRLQAEIDAAITVWPMQ
jgi:predicted helicase